MILTVIHDEETDIAIAVVVATALFAAGLTQGFPDSEDSTKLVAYRETGAAGGGIQVQSSVANGPFVKAAFVAVKFQILEGVGALVPCPKTNVKSHTVTPALPDNQYPEGTEATGRAAATGLCGACLTQPIPPDDDPFKGDPGVSMQILCDDSDKASVIKGFGAVGFGVD
ncbi:MAG TPA: hypothetical protein VN865_15760 [Candidatus Acidoferrales bacterium]|nr:hypothetical protein [Candidatus Acidoferrales bacterium]